jgi:hypothetical protein
MEPAREECPSQRTGSPGILAIKAEPIRLKPELKSWRRFIVLFESLIVFLVYVYIRNRQAKVGL